MPPNLVPVLLCVLLSATPVPCAASTIAVFPFEVAGFAPAQSWIGDSFAEAHVDLITRTTEHRVVERAFLSKILQEQRFALTDLASPSSCLRIGQLEVAEIVVLGDVRISEGAVNASARWVDASSGVIQGLEESSGSADEVPRIRSRLAAQVAARLGGAQADHPVILGPATADEDRILKMLRALTATFPPLGFDPQRTRRESEYRTTIALTQTLSSNTISAMTAVELSKVLVQLGEYDQARLLLTSEVPSAFRCDAALVMANAAYVQGDLARAERELCAVVRQCGGDGRVWAALARVRLAAGNRVGALFALLSGVESRGPHRDIMTQLSTVLSAHDADVTISGLARVDRQLSLIASALRQHLLNNTDQAGEVLMGLTATHESFATHMIRGRYLAARGSLDGALYEFERSLALRADQSDVYRELSLVEARRGNCMRASDLALVYATTADRVTDYDQLEKEVRRCRER